MVDKDKLEKAIKDSGLKKSYISKKMGLSLETLKNKMTGRSKWYIDECLAIKSLLGISDAEAIAIFFADDVAKTATSTNETADEQSAKFLG